MPSQTLHDRGARPAVLRLEDLDEVTLATVVGGGDDSCDEVSRLTTSDLGGSVESTGCVVSFMLSCSARVDVKECQDAHVADDSSAVTSLEPYDSHATLAFEFKQAPGGSDFGSCGGVNLGSSGGADLRQFRWSFDA